MATKSRLITAKNALIPLETAECGLAGRVSAPVSAVKAMPALPALLSLRAKQNLVC